MSVQSSRLAILVAGFELVQSHRYDQWRAHYEEKDLPQGTITVASKTPAIIWEYRANQKFHDDKYDIEISTNEHGFRDLPGRTPAKAAGVLRVAFVGDSVKPGPDCGGP